MTYLGHVQNGVVVFEGSQTPPEGATVEVALVSENQHGLLSEALLEFAGSIDGLPADMAQQHDHYLHGRPKR